MSIVGDDPDDEKIGFTELVDEDGLTPSEALTVLRGETLIPRWEAAERWEMLRRERGARP